MQRKLAEEILLVAPEIVDALADGRAVVALESTIITHGMPYPANLDMAREVEALIRAEGAVPATIALLGGRIRVGLDAAFGAANDFGGVCQRCPKAGAAGRGRRGGNSRQHPAAVGCRWDHERRRVVTAFCPAR